MSFTRKALLALTLSLCLNLTGYAQNGQGGGPKPPKDDPQPSDPGDELIAPGTVTTNFGGGFGGGSGEAAVAGDIQSRYETAGLDVLDASVFGDHVDIDTGALSFVHIDVSLPGNSALPVQIGRSLSPLSAGWGHVSGSSMGFGNWDATIPHIRQTFLTENGPQSNRCTGTLGGPYLTYGGATGGDLIYRWQFWNGFQLSMGGKPIALLEHDNSPEFTGQSPRMVSKNGDIITCISNIGGGQGEGFKLTQRDGTTYEFKKRVEFDIQNTTDNFDDRLEVFFVTRIEDVHNNYVNYTYSGNNLTRIQANDGRRIDITWNSGGITRVTANGRQWDYTYSSGDLDRVTLPDGTYWDFSATEAITRYPDGTGCLASYPDVTVKHPAGAHATFEFDPVTNGRTNAVYFQSPNPPVGFSECTVGYPQSPSAFITTAVTKKTITVPSGPTQVWTWSYQQDNGQYQTTNEISPIKTRTVTYPDGHQVKTHINRRFSWTEGNIEKIETFDSTGGLIKTQEFTYQLGHEVGDRLFAVGHTQSLSATYQTYQTEVETTLDSETYKTVNEFETNPASSAYAFGSPKKVTETSSTAPGLSRIAEHEYVSYKTPWILALPTKTTRNGKIFDQHTYSSSTGVRLTTKNFGVTTGTFSYNGDGTLSSVSDALSRTTQYSSYKRGIPQSVTLPDSNTISRVVDNNGWVTSYTNPRGYTFGMSYDSMGRMTLFNRPGSWADTSVSFSSLGTGLVQTVTRGNARSTTTFDGYYRPTLIKGEDLTGHSSARYTKTSYDSMGRTSFASWPSTIATPTAGVNTSYDALGRVTQTQETVSPNATTTTAYLSDNRIRVTDPSGAQTTTTYRAFGSPGTDEATKVEDAVGTITNISRDIYGNITHLNQDDTSIHNQDADRYFYYDARLRLCRHSAPEFGDELFAYDDANQMTSSGRGHSSGTQCATPSSLIRTEYSYDAMGRQTLINFPLGTHDISKTYDANGNVLTTNRGGVNWTYAYNDLDLMTSETLQIDGYTYPVLHGYDSSGNLSTRNVAGSSQFSYNPDGFGQPRQLALAGFSYVSNIQYHPTGAASSASYSNGWNYTHSLTSRQQTYEIKVQQTGLNAIWLRHAYDARSKITGITDFVLSSHNRTFGYDARGRLTSASGYWGTGTFEYDGLDNVRQKVLGSRTVDVSYSGSTNLPTQYRDTDDSTAWQAFAHDNRGNMIDNGTWAHGGVDLTYDWANQPVTMVGTSINNTYTYDGNMKRAKTVDNGKVTHWVYSALTGTPVYSHQVTDAKTTIFDGAGGSRLEISPGDVDFTYLDHQGSPVASYHSDGSYEWRHLFTPFGETSYSTQPAEDRLGYTGHVEDDSTGLTYMQARFYDPVIGRFLSTDPIGYQDQMNLYAYVHNDPVNMVDPKGECSTDADGSRSGVCPNDDAAQQIIDNVNSVEGFTELSDLDASLESQGRLITVGTTDGDNGSLTVSAVVGDSMARATVGTETSEVMGTAEPGGELAMIPLTPEERLVHEVVGHGGEWAEMGTSAYMEMDSNPIGANDLGLHPTVPGTEAGPIAAENRFRAAQGNPARRTRYGGAITTAPRPQ